MGCEHEFELGQITADPWNTLQRDEWAYYYCTKCLFTVKKPVTKGLDATGLLNSDTAASEHKASPKLAPRAKREGK